MSKETTYKCDICGDKKEPYVLKGFTVLGCGGLSFTHEADNAKNHLCGRCFDQIGQIYNRENQK